MVFIAYDACYQWQQEPEEWSHFPGVSFMFWPAAHKAQIMEKIWPVKMYYLKQKENPGRNGIAQPGFINNLVMKINLCFTLFIVAFLCCQIPVSKDLSPLLQGLILFYLLHQLCLQIHRLERAQSHIRSDPGLLC